MMKKQIVFIHGGSAYTNYESFLTDLRTITIYDPYGLEKGKRWKESLREEFGSHCDVLYPSMPNSQNAKYAEWKIWFERYFEYLIGEVILIGHSQGGYFLAKYLSENVVPFPVLAVYLISAPFEPDDFGGEDGGDFSFDPKNLKNIAKMAKNIVIIHSTDDEVVPFRHSMLYRDALPTAENITFTDRGHFLQAEFPEIIESIKIII